ncbi:hypothetical protein AC579_2920 [Pseudocercospora musae]|uniref:Uncharacterized protein n=1 Tax=Pseudocercospora musae TaxID=113226 RepID=A0A139IUP0_9PEZI|nr:hypothetical protein AC579_2920 [Pseudocercospora musae]
METITATQWTAIATNTVYATSLPSTPPASTSGSLSSAPSATNINVPMSGAAITVTASMPTAIETVHLPASSASSKTTSIVPSSAVTTSTAPPSSSSASVTTHVPPKSLSEESSTPNGLSGGTIAAIITAVLGAFIFSIIALVLWRRFGRKRESKEQPEGIELGNIHRSQGPTASEQTKSKGSNFSQRPYEPNIEEEHEHPSPLLPSPTPFDFTGNKPVKRVRSDPVWDDSLGNPYALRGLPSAPPLRVPLRYPSRPQGFGATVIPRPPAQVRPADHGFDFGVPKKKDDGFEEAPRTDAAETERVVTETERSGGRPGRWSAASSMYSQESVRGSEVGSWRF